MIVCRQVASHWLTYAIPLQSKVNFPAWQTLGYQVVTRGQYAHHRSIEPHLTRCPKTVWIAADFLVVISLICLLLQAINCSDSNITQIRRLNGWPALNTCLAQHYRHVSVSAKTQRLALITILIESPFSLPFGLYSVGGCFPNSASCWLRGWNPTDRQDNSVMQEDIFA